MSSYHAWTHAPKSMGGTDPLPVDAIASDRALEYVFGGNYFRFAAFINNGEQGSFSAVRDATLAFGGYIECTSQNAYFVIGFPLGPRWSCWSIDAVYSRGTDYGILDFDWATAPIVRTEAGFDDDGYDIGKPDFPNYPDPTDDADWFELDSGQTISGYAAVPVAEENFEQVGRTMRITGKYGDQLTANGVSGPGLVQSDFNGGDGNMWWLRGKLKSAGTGGGFRFRLHYLRLVRTYQDIGYPL